MSFVVLQRDVRVDRSEVDGKTREELELLGKAMIAELAKQFLSTLPEFLKVSFDYNERHKDYVLSAEVEIASPGKKQTAAEDFAAWVNSRKRIGEGVKRLHD